MRKRTQARELALKYLYQIDVTKNSLEENLDNFWSDIKAKEEVREYADGLIKGARQHLGKIDVLIKENAQNWEISRMAVIDRNILRICTFELLFREDVPPKVAINEAIELAKKFGDTESSKFVNGVMDKILRATPQKSTEAQKLKNLSADLHIHSSFSDGTFSPQELIKEAEKRGLSCIAITDHDCIEAIAPALAASLIYSVEVIPSVELTAEIDNTEVHILGYFIEYNKEGFNKKLKVLCRSREERMYKMVEKLNVLGIKIEPKEVLESSGEGSVGRLHLAQVLLQKGYIKTIAEAFQKYIGNRAPCYVNRFKLSPQEAIEMIKEVRGIPVLAHPHNMNRDDLIPALVRDGLEGIEVYHPDHSASVTTHYLEMAEEFNLLVTGGSDCHGLGKGKVLMGTVKVPYELVENLKEKKAKINGA